LDRRDEQEAIEWLVNVLDNLDRFLSVLPIGIKDQGGHDLLFLAEKKFESYIAALAEVVAVKDEFELAPADWLEEANVDLQKECLLVAIGKELSHHLPV
jgi:hypothetical protein